MKRVAALMLGGGMGITPAGRLSGGRRAGRAAAGLLRRCLEAVVDGLVNAAGAVRDFCRTARGRFFSNIAGWIILAALVWTFSVLAARAWDFDSPNGSEIVEGEGYGNSKS